MNFQEFTDAVLDQIPDYISGNNYRFFLSNLTQSNNELEYTLNIEDIHSEELHTEASVIPSFCLESFYFSFMEGVSLETILIQIAKSYGDFLENQYLSSTTNRWEEHAVIQLLPTSSNLNFLKTVHHKNMLDLSIVYHYPIDQPMSYFLPVRNDLVHIMDLEEYHQRAINNTTSYLGIDYIPMDADRMELEDNCNEVAISRKKGGITMITNRIHQYGAALLAIPEYLEEVATYLDDDMVIIPSSIHEIGVIKYSEIQISVDKLRDMVQSINRNDLDPSVVLSDNLYFYSKKEKELRILE